MGIQMYSAESLSNHPFFAQALRSATLEELHDPLSGVIARPVMLRFVRDLIERGAPFMLAMIDLDSFKAVNDNYGHRTGDRVLAAIAADLREFVGQTGIIGRYGGDEFLLAYFGSTEYVAVHDFFMRMFHSGKVFRRELDLGDAGLYMTATVGSVSFPKDGQDAEMLFTRADKALYRGKDKGRNCFIIYVKEKHEKLDVNKLSKRSIYETIRRMTAGFDSRGDVIYKLGEAFAPMREELDFSRLLCVGADGALIDVGTGDTLAHVELPDGIVDERIRAVADIIELEKSCSALCEALREMSIYSLLIAHLHGDKTPYRYLIFCPEAHTMRIWQDSEFCAAFVLAELLSRYRG